MGHLLGCRAPMPTLCNRVEALLRFPQDPGRDGFHLQHERLRLDRRKALGAGKRYTPDHESWDLQTAKMVLWVVGAMTKPWLLGAEECPGRPSLPSIFPEHRSRILRALWEPWSARRTFQPFKFRIDYLKVALSLGHRGRAGIACLRVSALC